MNQIKFKKPVVINGRGDSLWGQSRGAFHINLIKIESNEIDYSVVEMFGPDTDWAQYTDSGIEKEINKKLKTKVSKLFGREVKSITWSEQGMQPEGGWNFDVDFYKRKKK